MEMPEVPRERRTLPRTITPLTLPAASGVGLLRFPLKPPGDSRARPLGAAGRRGVQRPDDDCDRRLEPPVARDARRATDRASCAGCRWRSRRSVSLDAKATVRIEHEDGVRVKAGEPVLFVTGHARGLLSAERVALNYMQRLSGIATLTWRYVDAVRGTNAKILDTRKTTPGWRALEKYAVRAGGGTNHRMDLSTGVLIKDNHLAALDGDVAKAVERAREHRAGRREDRSRMRSRRASGARGGRRRRHHSSRQHAARDDDGVRKDCRRPGDSRGVGRRVVADGPRDSGDGRRLDFSRCADALRAVDGSRRWISTRDTQAAQPLIRPASVLTRLALMP